MSLTEYWNQSQSEYKQITKPSQYAQRIEPLLPYKAKILDLGGARGNDVLYFKNKGHIPSVLDIAEIAKEELNKKNSDINFIVLDLKITPYPFSKNYFDIIFSRLTLQYFHPNELTDIFREIKRLLKKKGIAYICVKSTLDDMEMESLRINSEEISPGVFLSEGIIKSRYTHEQYKKFLLDAEIQDYEINEISEKLDTPNKYGHTDLLLTEIIIKN